MKRFLAGVGTVLTTAVLAVTPVAAASGGGYTLFGDAQLVSPGHNSPTAAQTRSSASVAPGYGGIDFAVPAGTTLSDLNNLATDYMFTEGSCAGGAPRFQVNVTNGTNSGNIFVYIGPPPSYTACPPDVWLGTGNLASPTNLVDTSQLPLGTFYDPYAAAQTKYGSYTVTGIQLVTDGSWALVGSPQTVRFDNTQINDTIYTYEGKDSCKKGGWEQFSASPGPFKNQGQCVSYFARQ